ncbi:LysR substrate-binding domain-containing protein [Paraglaciecola sp. 2405UD69-4]|uniref:LysR substrate-binding domain-containing protein n=1 Tax=Paraglaciecola sp. 2405UD69-4 TaxID=3391836 RepID=UPI0039C9EBAB
MDRFDEMKVFIRIAERKSFTLAAEDLLLPKSTVTNLLKRLEKRLNTRLIERTTRQVNLTPDGARFFTRCANLLSELDEMENLFLSSSPKGLLRVNLQGTLAKHFVVPYLDTFLTQYPEISMHVAEDDRQIDLINEGVDCVLRAGELSDSSLIGRRLTSLTQATVASPYYLEKYGTPNSLAELKHHKAIGYSLDTKSKPTSLDFISSKDLFSFEMNTSITVAGADLYTGSALAGLGLIQVPRYRIGQELEAGKLIEVLTNFPPPSMPVSVLYPSKKHLSSRTRVFIEWLTLRFRNYEV